MRLKELLYQIYLRLYKFKSKIKFAFNIEYYYIHELENIPEVSANININIDLLVKNEEKLLLEVWPVNMDQIATRLKEGHSECYISSIDNTISSYHWVQFSGIHYIQQANFHFKIIPNYLFIIYHVRVKDNFR